MRNLQTNGTAFSDGPILALSLHHHILLEAGEQSPAFLSCRLARAHLGGGKHQRLNSRRIIE